MRPACHANRPASTASRIARAMRTGSRAPAIAVLSSTPSMPSSIAIATSDAVPTPASTITGTRTVSRIIARLWGLRMPSPEPIGAASGIAHGAAAGGVGEHLVAALAQQRKRGLASWGPGLEAPHRDRDEPGPRSRQRIEQVLLARVAR